MGRPRGAYREHRGLPDGEMKSLEIKVDWSKRDLTSIGSIRRRSETKRIMVNFDPDTFDEVLQRAVKSGHSFSYEAALLVEMGLETMKQDEQTRTT